MKITSKVLFLTFLMLSLLGSPAWGAQAPTLEWEKNYGNGYLVQALANEGGYVLLGSRETEDSNYFEPVLIKTDADGEIIMEKAFPRGTKYLDLHIQSFTPALDGGYVFSVRAFLKGKSLYFLTKTDENFNTLWEKPIDGKTHFWLDHIVPTVDGGYVTFGTINGANKLSDNYLIKFDSSGKKIWESSFGHKMEDYPYSVKQTADKGFLISGSSDLKAYLAKVNSNGKLLWSKTYSGAKLTSFVENSDGSLTLASFTDLGSEGGIINLISTDPNGKTKWSKTISTKRAWITGIIPVKNKGYLLAGSCETPAHGGNMYFIRTDTSGKVLWEKTYGTDQNYELNSLVSTIDNGFAVAGFKQLSRYDHVPIMVFAKFPPEPDPNKILLEVDKNVLNPDAEPFLNKENRVMVPIRFIADAFHADTQWDGSDGLGRVDITKIIDPYKRSPPGQDDPFGEEAWFSYFL